MIVLTTFLILGVLAVLSHPAGAQTTDPGAYVGNTTIVPATDSPGDPNVAATVQAKGAALPASQSRGVLPVTGGDVTGLLGLAAVLIVIGGAVLIVRRRLAPDQA